MHVPKPVSRMQTPESQGLHSAALAATLHRILDEDIKINSVMVARHGQVVLDVYRHPFAAGMRHDLCSMTKSVTALVVGAVLSEHDDFGMSLPLVADGSMTVGDVLSMTTGLACGLIPGDAAQFAEMWRAPDWATYVEQLPRLQPAGTHFSYSNPVYHLVSAYISRTTGMSLEAQAKRLLFGPLGITDWYWRADPLGRTVGWGDLSMPPRDAARIGQLVLEGGRVAGRQVLPQAWVEEATRMRIDTGQGDEAYSYGFWRPPNEPDVVAMQGRGGQQIILKPDQDLMVVLTASGCPEALQFTLFSNIIANDGPVADDAVADAALACAVERFSSPPPRQPITRGSAVAAALLAGALAVSDNPLGLQSIYLNTVEGEGLFTAVFQSGVLTVPIGFDGVSRIAPGPMNDDGTVGIGRGGPVAGIGRWTSPDRLKLEITLYGEALRFLFNVRFPAGAAATLRLTEGTGYCAFDAVLASRAHVGRGPETGRVTR